MQMEMNMERAAEHITAELRAHGVPADVPADVRMKMLVLHAPEQLGLKQEYIQEHAAGAGH